MFKELVSTLIGLGALFAASHLNAEPSQSEKSALPAMWVARDSDTTIYLFGTYHMVPDAVEWRTSAFNQAMQAADVTFLEADSQTPEGQAQVQAVIGQSGFNPEGTTLTAQLGPERSRTFAKLAERAGIPMAQLERLRPWLAVVAVTQRIYAQQGLTAEGIDARIFREAKAEGDEIRSLESPATQIEALSQLGGEEMLRHVDQGIANVEELDTYINALLSAWSTGDVAALEQLVIAKMESETPNLFHAIFVERNAAWAETIISLMDGEGDYLIAVGAGHLVGEGSVIRMLRERGINVERVQ